MERPSRDQRGGRRPGPGLASKPGDRRSRGVAIPQQRKEPTPIGDRCNPLCPLFRCAKRALIVRRIGNEFVAWCSWTNDRCICHQCQYASCVGNYLLPDGRCAYAIRAQHEKKKELSFEEEIELEAKAETRVKSLLARRGIGKDLESELL